MSRHSFDLDVALERVGDGDRVLVRSLCDTWRFVRAGEIIRGATGETNGSNVVAIMDAICGGKVVGWRP